MSDQPLPPSSESPETLIIEDCPIDRVRLSNQAKNQLIKLKRITKIEHWNVLCRWAFCRSLAEPHKPAPYNPPADSNLEMTWHTFAGDLDEILLLALIYRCHKDGLPTDPETLKQQFRLHLHRGIGYLVAECEVKKLTHFIRLLYRENKNTD